LVEQWIVVPLVAGSSPVVHPIFSPLKEANRSFGAWAAPPWGAFHRHAPCPMPVHASPCPDPDKLNSGKRRKALDKPFKRQNPPNRMPKTGSRVEAGNQAIDAKIFDLSLMAFQRGDYEGG
jgi:hypothetical protein